MESVLVDRPKLPTHLSKISKSLQSIYSVKMDCMFLCSRRYLRYIFLRIARKDWTKK